MFAPAALLSCLIALPATAQQVPVGAQMPELGYSPVTTERYFSLSHYVDTTADGAPPQPQGVYLQFGFMGCEPCHRLAEVANAELGDRVLRVYVHLDDVVMTPGMTTRQLVEQLYGYVTEGVYASFLTVRGGSTAAMQSWCGAGADAPSGLLIAPDGTVHHILTSPTLDEARAAFSSFVAALP